LRSTKRSVFIAGHKTSVSVEDAFWKDIGEIARASNMSASGLIRAINSERKHPNLSSAIRLFVLEYYRRKLGRAGTS
jgi:predicted DNA-binding ribbon-helix-helix protein